MYLNEFAAPRPRMGPGPVGSHWLKTSRQATLRNTKEQLLLILSTVYSSIPSSVKCTSYMSPLPMKFVSHCTQNTGWPKSSIANVWSNNRIMFHVDNNLHLSHCRSAHTEACN